MRSAGGSASKCTLFDREDSALHHFCCPASGYRRPSRNWLRLKTVGSNSNQPRQRIFPPFCSFSSLCCLSVPVLSALIQSLIQRRSKSAVIMDLPPLPHPPYVFLSLSSWFCLHTLLLLLFCSVLFPPSPIFCMAALRLGAKQLYCTVQSV